MEFMSDLVEKVSILHKLSEASVDGNAALSVKSCVSKLSDFASANVSKHLDDKGTALVLHFLMELSDFRFRLCRCKTNGRVSIESERCLMELDPRGTRVNNVSEWLTVHQALLPSA